MKPSEQDGLDKLKMRLERLNRLMEMGAPNIVLVHEIKLVYNASWLAFPEEMKITHAQEKLEEVKKRSGWCINDNCDNRSFGSSDGYCEQCDKQFEEIDQRYN